MCIMCACASMAAGAREDSEGQVLVRAWCVAGVRISACFAGVENTMVRRCVRV